MRDCSTKPCSDPLSLRPHLSELSFPSIVSSNGGISIFWIDKVLAPPLLRMIAPIRGPVQKTLWKVALALAPASHWTGNLTKNDPYLYTFKFEESQKFKLQACLIVFLIGKFTVNNSFNIVECSQC